MILVMKYLFIYLFGALAYGLTELSDRDERIYALNRIMAHYSDCDSWEFDDRYLSVVTILKLSVETLSCKEH